jgi:hypothetical protein
VDTFIRWSGLGLVGAGVLTLSALWHPDIFETGLVAVSAEPSWVLGHVAGMLVVVLTLLAVAGCAARLGPAVGRLGAVGAVLAVVGLVATAGLMAIEAFAFPVLAREAPALLDLDGPLLGTAAIRAVGGLALLWFVGLCCVGVATERAGVLPRGPGWLMAVGVVAFAAFEGPFVPVLGPVSVVVFAAGQAWFGLSLATARSSAGAVDRPDRLIA